MRTIDADVLKEAFEMDGYKSPYIARMIDACPTVEFTIDDIKRALVEVKKTCMKQGLCRKCHFWDDNLKCRLNGPNQWWIDDWKEDNHETN